MSKKIQNLVRLRSLQVALIGLVVVSTVLLGCHSVFASTLMNIGKEYDYTGRLQITTELVRSSNRADFYVESEFYNKLNSDEKSVLLNRFINLGVEFDNHIYPILTQTYGYNGRLNQSGQKLNIIVHPLKEGVEGYVRSIDFFNTTYFVDSNNHLTVYLDYNAFVKSSSTDLELAAFLAHEFTHIISLETKDFRYGISEDTWLAEARSEYSENLLGYPTIYWQGSILKRRLAEFTSDSTFDFINWQNSASNYAAVNLFTQYLIEHYGSKVLIDTLQNNSLGINSLNISLARNGYKETFTDIYRNWAIANTINDCTVDHNQYCYTDDHLREFVVMPIGYYLPTSGEAYMTANNNLNPWAIHYQKIVGGHDNVQLDFEKPNTLELNKLTYIIVKSDQSREVKTLDLTGKKQATLNISDFGGINAYVVLVLYKENGSIGYDFVWKVSTGLSNNQTQAALVANLLKQIETLRQQLAYLLALKTGNSETTTTTVPTTCGRFTTDLKYGITNNSDVRCLQKFLASQQGIYPSGLITGNYLTYTKLAVSNFQDETGVTPTGYFGPLTRAKVNSMLGF
jgi:peptidoglycan hydrolase-like protein with peptidoglycan-binding domain